MEKKSWEQSIVKGNEGDSEEISFRDKVEERIKNFNQEQCVHFAWLCAVRALPFLSVRRHFNYWEEDERQKHLLSVLRAIDFAGSAYVGDEVAIADSAAEAAYAAAAAADAATGSAADATEAVARAADAAAGVADAAAYAVSAVSEAAVAAAAAGAAAAADTTATAVAATAAAAGAAARAATAATFAASNTRDVEIENIFNWVIMNDIEVVESKESKDFHHDTSIYRNNWKSLLEDLRENDCGYWAKHYDELFENGLEEDEEELFRRLYNVPDEIRWGGAASVGRYMENSGDEMERLDEARIIILGEKGAGKTSLARRLVKVDAPMPKEEESTEGVSVLQWRLHSTNNDGGMNIHIWDFAGHSITHSAHRCFMSFRCLYIYVYNGRMEHNNRPEYWLEQIRIYGGDSPILFVINEEDKHKSDIERKTLKNLYPTIQDYYSVDIGSKDQTRLKEFRRTVKECVHNNPSWKKQEIPLDAYLVKRDLRNYFESKKEDSIQREEFDEIARKNGVPPERFEQILSDLHALGACLWYNTEDMLEFNMLVLNPDWITNGIYKIINWGHNNEKHILSMKEHGMKIFENEEDMGRYPLEKIKFLFRVMEVYELAFFKDDKGEEISIPGILPIDRPEYLPDFPPGERLAMEFRVERALPPDIVSRLIVRRNEEVTNDKEIWRKGAILSFKDGEAMACVIEEDRSISVRVKGKDKTAYISSLRETLGDIFDSYKRIEPNLMYEVLIPSNIEEQFHKTTNRVIHNDDKPLMLDEKDIVGHLQQARPYFKADMGFDIPLDQTKDGYAINYIRIDALNLTTNNIAPRMENSSLAIAERDSSVSFEEDDHSINTTYNVEIHDSAVTLQGELSNLASSLSSKGYEEESEYVQEVYGVVEEAQKIVEEPPAEGNVEETLKKKGIISKMKEFLDDLTDEESELNQNTAKLRKGAKKIQGVLKTYNDFAKLVPVLPQVPDAILNLGKSPDGE